jgi:galactokinase/mevalonate kinase-like predicted kinase
MKPRRSVVTSAPARVNLLGNPSDLYGGAVLACSLPLRARVELEPADGLALEYGSEQRRIAGRSDLALCGDLFDVARAALLADLDRQISGRDDGDDVRLPALRIHYASDIPFGSGLAGSTALLVALLSALAAWRGEPLSPYGLAERSRVTERRLLGIACGWVDHYLCSFGGLRYVDLRGKDADDAPAHAPYATVEDLSGHVPSLPFVLAFTGVAHHSGSVHAPIRARWERGEPAVVATYERMTAIAREGKRALLDADWPQLGALLDENHTLTRELGGSGEANERLIAAARSAGALGAKLAGAGGGGTIVALWPDPDASALERALLAAGATALYRPAVKKGAGVVSGGIFYSE